MKLSKIEAIEKRLMEIRDIISLEDAYPVCDAIITSINDELLAEHIENMLKALGYDNKTCKKIKKIIQEIQN